MAEAKTEIKIDVDYTGRAEVRRAIQDMKRLDRQVAKTGAGFASATKAREIRDPDNFTGDKFWRRLRKQVTEFDKAVSLMGKVGLKGLNLALKGSALSMAAMGAAMLAVHAAFILGNGAMKAMKATLGPLAAGMAAVTAAAATAAAAVREQQAAMYAYKQNNKGEFGSGLNQSRQVMRALHTDTYLAAVGVENLNKAFATVSKNSTFTMKSQNMLKGLMDFASAGQPIEEGIQKAADLIAILQDGKKSFAEAKTSAEQLFPDKKAMDKALKDLKITTKKGLEKAVSSGELAKAAGLEGQFEAVSGTLINRLKGYFNILRNQFADLGQPMLEPVKQAANDIFQILRRGFVKISASTQQFGMGSMLEGLVSMTQKLTDMTVNLVNTHVKSVDGMFSRLGNWWNRFRDGWDDITDKMRPFIDGARVIESFFGEIWKHVKNIFSAKFGQFNEFLIKNEDAVKGFGDSIGQLLADIFELIGEFNKLTQKMLPFIDDVVKGLSMVVQQLTSLMKLINGIGGGPASSLAMLFGMRGMFQGMQNRGQGGYKMIMVNGKPTAVPTGPGGTRPGTPTGPTVITGPPAGGIGTTHATPPGTPPTPGTPTPPVVPTTPGTPGAPGGPSPMASRVPLQRPEYEVFKRAPRGGITIGGKFYKGGQMLPTSQITAAERAYYNIEDIGRPGKMAPMVDTATDVGTVSMRAGTVIPGAATTPAAASASAFASVSSDSRGRPIAGPGGVTVNGKYYPKGRQLPAGYASMTVTPGGGPGTTPSTGGGGGAGTTPPTGGAPAAPTTGGRTRTYINKLQQAVRGPSRDSMYLPSGPGEDPILKDVASMTDEEYKLAKQYEKAYGQKAYRGGVVPQPGDKGNLTLRGRYNQRAIRNRTAMDSSRGRQLRGAVGSTTGKMGGSIALGMASQYMPEEARGAMALGSMVSQINPLAGVAVAGLGTAMNSRTAGGGAVSGALGGAAAGAMLGSILPGIGTAAGAIVGTLVGGMGGAIIGHFRKHDLQAKKARAVADKQIESIINTSMSFTFRNAASEAKSGNLDEDGNPRKSSTRTMFNDAISRISKQQPYLTDKTTGQGAYDANGILKDTATLVKELTSKGVKFSEQDVKDIRSKPQEYINNLQKKGAENMKAMGAVQEKYNNRLDALGKMTGKTDQELIDLASTMGVNLGDATMDFTVMLEKLGLTMVRTAQEMQGLSISGVVDSFSIFDTAIKQWETPRILDEMARTFRDKADAGSLTFRDKAEFLQGVGEQNTVLFGTGGVAQAQFEESFQKGGSAFKAGGPFAGLDPDTFLGDPEIEALLNRQKTDSRTAIGQQYATQINAVLSERGFGQAIDANKFVKEFQNLSTDELARVSKFIEGDASKGIDSLDTSNYRGGKTGAEAFAAILGIDPAKLGIMNTSVDNKKTASLDTAALGISEASTKLIQQMDAFFQRDKDETPEWFTMEAFNKLIESTDTSTPRGSRVGDTTSSRLAVTMGRHSAMDGMLTGKRTVTSAYRNYGLGSINSDHVTGRAYDLVGQNLGQYQKLVTAGGGFAEFHGTGGGRHLHVVPGPGIMGDTKVPMASSNKPMGMTMGGSKGETNYTFHIQGSQNASPQQIADAVMVRIKETERSNRERR